MESSSRTIFLGVMGAPYESELTTTLFRVVDAALAAHHHVAVWTCGGATTLTLRALGTSKPRNPLDIGSEVEPAEYPSTARLVEALLSKGDGRLRWLVCRHCMEERGASDQIPGVKIQPPFRFLRFLEQSDARILMGVK